MATCQRSLIPTKRRSSMALASGTCKSAKPTSQIERVCAGAVAE